MTPALKRRLGEQLVAQGQLDHDHLRIALQEQSRVRMPLGRLLTRMEFSGESEIWGALALQQGLPRFDPLRHKASPDALALIPPTLSRKLGILPLAVSDDGRRLSVAISCERHESIRENLLRTLPSGIAVELLLASEAEIDEGLRQHEGPALAIDHLLPALEQSANIAGTGAEAPAIQVLDAILANAVARQASDIHLEPEHACLRIRYRIDGILHPVRILNKAAWPLLCGRIKVMSGMNIAETRAPQDGHIGQMISGRMIDFRVASQPTLHGENLVLRLLDRHKGIVPLDKLGLRSATLAGLQRMIRRPEGLLLVAGPTGSGKTTTLYSVLSALNTPQVHIMTLEDPVEYPLPLIRQTSLSDNVKLEFASGVRSMLRQDPDIILIGEIRDAETAAMALRAALTGHQVHATLHAGNAIGALSRLHELGIRTEQLHGNLIGILAQRLLRRLCPHCKIARPPTAAETLLVGDSIVHEPGGCPECEHRGYRGRLAIAEVLRIDAQLDSLLAAAAPQSALLEAAHQNGFASLQQDGLEQVRAGETSLAELARVVDIDAEA